MLHGLVFDKKRGGNKRIRSVAGSGKQHLPRQSRQGFDLLHNRRGINAEVRQQFRRFARTRQRRHGELVDFDSIHAEFAGDRVAQTAFEIMIFDGNDGVAGLLRGGLDDVPASGLML